MELRPFDIGVIRGNMWNPLHMPIIWRSMSRDVHCVIFRDRLGYIFDTTIGGILNEHIGNYKNRYITIIRYNKPFDADKLLLWVLNKQKTCKGYDWKAWIGFALNSKRFEDEDMWFCSETPYWAFTENGYKITNEEMKFPFPSTLVESLAFDIVWKGDVKKLLNSINGG